MPSKFRASWQQTTSLLACLGRWKIEDMTALCWLFQDCFPCLRRIPSPQMCIRDPAYPLGVSLHGPFKGPPLTPQQEAFNQYHMSKTCQNQPAVLYCFMKKPTIYEYSNLKPTVNNSIPIFASFSDVLGRERLKILP